MAIQWKVILQSRTFHKALLFMGVVSTLGTIIFGWGGIDFVINITIRKMMRLIPGTTLWETWKTIPIPVYMKFYLFNVTNSDKLSQGARPKLNEMGPFVYLVDFEKYDFSKNETTDTVRYQPSKTYIFQPAMSKGKEDDMITYINVIFVGVSHIAHGFTDVEFLLETLDGMLAEKGEKLTRTDKVKDLLFDGASIQNYVDLVNDPLVQQAGSIDLPEDFKDGLFAIFKGKNGTRDGWWECHTGIRESNEIGKIYKYKGQSKLDLYNGDTCNAINGTDGTLNPPFIEPGVTDLYVFIPELCRSIQWQFMTMSQVDGIDVARYKFPDLESVPENPDLACFCHKKDPMECDIHGIASLAPCFGGAPLLFSKPHFLDVESSIRKLVEGLQPKNHLHESKLHLHPLTGAAVTASIKMQFSIELVPWPSMPSFANASRAIVPFAWIELLATLDGFSKFMIWALATFLNVYPILRWLALLGSIGMALLGGFLTYRYKKEDNAVVDLAEEEEITNVEQELGVWIKKFNKNDIPQPQEPSITPTNTD